jgi:hypothetical protein
MPKLIFVYEVTPKFQFYFGSNKFGIKKAIPVLGMAFP